MTTLAQILHTVLGFVDPMAQPQPAKRGTGFGTSGPIYSSGDTHQIDVMTDLNARCVRKIGPQPRERLDWAHSIVDLLKLLDLDSSLAARRKLAIEMHYDGDLEDTNTMNQWLHAKVMDELATHGGQVPDELRSSSRVK
jgi:hypothetical protein